jgi:hypothetical protein
MLREMQRGARVVKARSLGLIGPDAFGDSPFQARKSPMLRAA